MIVITNVITIVITIVRNYDRNFMRNYVRNYVRKWPSRAFVPGKGILKFIFSWGRPFKIYQIKEICYGRDPAMI